MKSFLKLFFLFIPILLQAQFGETIRTGRPGQSIGPYTLGKQVFQLQTGYNYNAIDDENLERDIMGNNTVTRVGITERIELSALLNWVSEESLLMGESESLGGMNALHIGGRINLTENEGWVPAVGLQSRFILNVVNKEYRSDHLGNALVLATGNKLTDDWGLTTNWAAVWDGNNSDAIYIYIINLGHSIDDKWGIFIETYGNFDSFEPNVDAGISYLVNPDFQLDLSGGWQGHDGVSDWFIDAGISWRLVWRDNQ